MLIKQNEVLTDSSLSGFFLCTSEHFEMREMDFFWSWQKATAPSGPEELADNNAAVGLEAVQKQLLQAKQAHDTL